MGSRGLRAYRYRRRYFTKYIHTGSDLDCEGAGLVQMIPTDPVQFKKWVEKVKEELEQRYKMWQDADVFIEHTYVIGLDRNVFTIDEVAHLPLDAIPCGQRGRDWMEAVYDPKHPARIATLSLTVLEPDPRHLSLYDTAGATGSLELPSDNQRFAFPTCGVLMDCFFRQLRFVYSNVWNNIDQYEPNHPDFRALAEAVLAIATWGEFYMCSCELQDSYERQVISDGPSWADLERDDTGTHFWRFSTLIVLEVCLEDEQRLRSAVGRAVGLWRSSSRPIKHQTAFVISLKSVSVVHISPGAVSHTPPIELGGAVTESQPSFETSSHTPGFALLKRHFTPELPPSNVDAHPRLPLEVLERILDLCGDATLSALTMTCKSIRTMCLLRPRFVVGNYRLVYHVADSEFRALDVSGVMIPVVVGKLGCAVETRLPGGDGYNLILRVVDRFGDDAIPELMGLRCIPKELGGADGARLVEMPDTDWRMERIHGLG
ncbi:hypothetical protein AURDEDRAFT_182982 [Auricularia subglabra TFB-10046 SS5]|nr:hypothetical protein AURDEDRAFT_182982 [Auricularia subglabra TFB-10046 SS5]